MIQRIQTIYLLVITVLLIVMMCLPVGNFIAADNSITEMNNLSLVAGEVANYKPWALFAILLVSALVSFFTIFMFKKRMQQIRLSIFNIVLMIGYYITLVAFILILKGDASFVPAWTVCLPFIALVFDWLAIRAIGKDEMLVKAYDRLR